MSQALTRSLAAPRVEGSNWDWPLLLMTATLVSIGLVFVYSASVPYAGEKLAEGEFFLRRQQIFVIAATLEIALISQVPLDFWKRAALPMVLLGIGLLVLVLIPGVGHEVNGSLRWLSVGGFRMQPSEWIKVAFVLYLALLLTRREQDSVVPLLGPLVVLLFITLLLLAEPDLGASAVLAMTAAGMLFLAGLPIWQFLLLNGGLLGAVTILTLISPYRLARLTAFIDPWADPLASGFQLTQSLMAFGRGGWTGVGLGESVQKLFYLPEAHTDFLLAVIAEELGLMAVLLLLAAYSWLTLRAFKIAGQARALGSHFASQVAYGLGLLIAVQALVNIGVNMGVLPTKGLTLPLLSYGGSSLLFTCFAVALLLRADHENRVAQ
ncbi:MAG: putative lipid II flippase FtsW [Gammaproteobacteria bacterium]